MATKEQYEFFRFLYEDEERTYEQLEARSRFYLALVSVFVAALVLKAPEARASATALGVPWWLLLIVTAILTGSLVFIALAARIRVYEAIADPGEIIESFGKTEPKNQDFFDDRIADLAVATKRNAEVNGRLPEYSSMPAFP